MTDKKQRTALSILIGLNQKFAREKEDQTYSSNELHTLFSELINQVNKGELMMDILEKTDPAMPKSEIWGVVDEAIERSKIKRYSWHKIFGKSLTQEILLLKKEGFGVGRTFEALSKDLRVENLINEFPLERNKILNNLKISVHARFGENNTAQMIMEGDNE